MTLAPRTRRIALLGLESATDLHRVVSKDFEPVRIPPDGLLLTSQLAEILSVRPGQSVTVEVLEGARPVRDVVVALGLSLEKKKAQSLPSTG